MSILEAVDKLNTAQKTILVPRIKEHIDSKQKDKIIAIWGLAFKPRTDDMREAPSIEIAKQLLAEGAKLQVHDPVAIKEARKIFQKKVTYCDQPYDALIDAHALVLVTEWSEFRNPDFDRMKKLMAGNAIFDGRNIYDPDTMKDHGFVYCGIGQ
jgi:UDPglucose 6-dehydrogenase